MDSFDVQQFLKSLTLQGDELPIGEVQEGEFADGIVECEDTLIGKALCEDTGPCCEHKGHEGGSFYGCEGELPVNGTLGTMKPSLVLLM
ncbi:hypothetical protein M9H77_18747 [Catharanthus roseus]|uniref:Uncharacterized protein n=1 Tax=Catharanthus roseus TaxID=4058 RepID=A0ACC0B8I6_CATRO|nr:hypothetical protein M9H77_18747 [Catharanthus roseus]